MYVILVLNLYNFCMYSHISLILPSPLSSHLPSPISLLPSPISLILPSPLSSHLPPPPISLVFLFPFSHFPPLSFQYGKVAKLTSDAKYEESDVKASLAALTFILSSAAKYSVDGESLDNELQQLGLPKGNLYVPRRGLTQRI